MPSANIGDLLSQMPCNLTTLRTNQSLLNIPFIIELLSCGSFTLIKAFANTLIPIPSVDFIIGLLPSMIQLARVRVSKLRVVRLVRQVAIVADKGFWEGILCDNIVLISLHHGSLTVLNSVRHLHDIALLLVQLAQLNPPESLLGLLVTLR